MKIKRRKVMFAITVMTVNVLAAEEHSQLVANLKAGKPQTMVTYGTSLTAVGAPWVSEVQQILQTNYPGLLTVINSGGIGQWSQWGVSNLEAYVIAKKPDTVFIELESTMPWFDSTARLRSPEATSPAWSTASCLRPQAPRSFS